MKLKYAAPSISENPLAYFEQLHECNEDRTFGNDSVPFAHGRIVRLLARRGNRMCTL
jgi:hypothetical protein